MEASNGTARLAILGTGNIGRAIALGVTAAGKLRPEQIYLTRRKIEHLDDLRPRGFLVEPDNLTAVRGSATVLLAVEPSQLDGLLDEIAPALDPRSHVVLSVVSGAGVGDVARRLPPGVPVVRAMPNTAVAIGQSMTCLAGDAAHPQALQRAVDLFGAVGRTLVVEEELMVPATALCACGIAFFLRCVRAASQGGIEIGFHPAEALTMAAQTALGAADLLLREGRHPEREIDSVTTPRGCTIAGLNEMEHQGLSSALIKGILTSAEQASGLYSRKR